MEFTMNMNECLNAYAITNTTLNEAQRIHLETEGYLILRNHISDEWLRLLQTR